MHRALTTKNIGLLWQLYREQQLVLRPEFQRSSVWPKAAKAYLIDTILNDRPIPLFFLQRSMSAQTGRPLYEVIDGQQRLTAMFEFLSGDLNLSESKGDSRVRSFQNKRFKELPPVEQGRIFEYDLVIEELSGYDDAAIRDMFVRMNRYVVKLSPQELRHAKEKGKFADFVERLGNWNFWNKHKVFSEKQINRMRAVEFSAELVVLLLEGPQDKKKVLDLYYHQYKETFPEGTVAEGKLKKYLGWIEHAIPELKRTRFRKPVDLYALIGALERVSRGTESLGDLDPHDSGRRLLSFDDASRQKPRGVISSYLLSASRQTDNIGPRRTRIDILANVIGHA